MEIYNGQSKSKGTQSDIKQTTSTWAPSAASRWTGTKGLQRRKCGLDLKATVSISRS